MLEISVLMAQFPSRQIAELSYRYRTLGLGFANIGGMLMAAGIGYDSAAGRAICGAISAIMTGVSYATSAEMARELGPFPGYHANAASTCCASSATTAAPPTAEATATRSWRSPPVPLDHASVPRQAPDRGRQARLGPRPRARREPRLPQRAGDRRRADRHDRPRHGLRHDRHRARLRAGEVQEAGRRRLLQDHQPGRARRAAHARLSPERDRRDRGLRRRSRLAGPGARDQPRRRSRPRASPPKPGQGRSRPRHRLRHQVRLQQVDARRGLLRRHAQGRRPTRSKTRPSTC